MVQMLGMPAVLEVRARHKARCILTAKEEPPQRPCGVWSLTSRVGVKRQAGTERLMNTFPRLVVYSALWERMSGHVGVVG